jgi:polyhydroxybutyrate depolymerase
MPSSPRLLARNGFGCLARRLAIMLTILAGFLPAVDAALVPQTWMVDDTRREALVWLPEKSGPDNPSPLVFAFHGHGGTMRHAARSFRLHEVWPEAIIVYPQGLDTPTPLVDAEGKDSGWQISPGAQGDRDLKFVDAMMESLRTNNERPVDEKRVYAMGHSNGGAFTYLLWSRRPELFAAYAPVAATPGRGGRPATPAPVIHVAGEKDTLVKFAWQDATIRFVRRLNDCGAGATWESDARCILHPSDKGAPLVTWIHPGGHAYPAEASALIVKFLQAHARP